MTRTTRLIVGITAAVLIAVGCTASDADTEVIQQPTTLETEGRTTEPPSELASTAQEITHYEAVVAEAVVDQVVAFREPDLNSEVVAQFDNPTEIGGPLVFTLVRNDAPAAGREWVEVRLPIRPNGTTGWVRSDQLSLTFNPYRIEIDASTFVLEVYRSNELWISTQVGIGTGDTPTPRGEFYITELLQPPNPDGLYGPYAFGLSGYSETLASFNGGEGVIGIHGTNEPNRLGSEVSHGCVRLANDVISELAAVIPLGTPVTITA